MAIKKYMYTYVVDFRGGTYCSQVKANNIIESLTNWIEEINKSQTEIKFLGRKTILELKQIIKEENNQPTQLNDLKNIWYTLFSTKAGVFHINIIKTDLSK